MSSEPVVITGIGMVTPLGATNIDTVQSWRAGTEIVRARSELLKGTVLESQEVAVIPAFEPAQRLKNRKMLKFMSDAAVLGCVAAREALEDADACRRFPAENIGLFAAAGIAGIDMREAMPMIRASLGEDGNFSCRDLGARGLPAANPLLSFKILANMPPCLISIIEGIKGPSLLFTPWQGMAGAALHEAWQSVAAGDIDCAVAGAADNSAVPTAIAYLRKSGLLGVNECASAGAGYIVMERLSSALKDNRRIYAKIVGITIAASDEAAQDPLVERMGRTYAAAPAIMLGLAAQIPIPESRMVGSDHRSIEFRLEKTA
jgi:3-oxoacyl-(acyl-carrier-protein) synthase